MGSNSIKNMVNVDLEQLSEMVPDSQVETALEEAVVPTATTSKTAQKARSKKYVAARSRVDRTKSYSLEEAVGLVKQTSYSRFDGTITAHLNLFREINPVDVTFPHSTGQQLRVAIADEELLEKLANEEIEFDILLATPAMMPKLAKYARFLGPRGLMPNPKSGTVTTDPESKKEALLGGAVTLRAEKKAPLLHVRVGKVSHKEEELLANVEALLKAVNRQNIAKLTLAATMGPGVKVQI